VVSWPADRSVTSWWMIWWPLVRFGRPESSPSSAARTSAVSTSSRTPAAFDGGSARRASTMLWRMTVNWRRRVSRRRTSGKTRDMGIANSMWLPMTLLPKLTSLFSHRNASPGARNVSFFFFKVVVPCTMSKRVRRARRTLVDDEPPSSPSLSLRGEEAAASRPRSGQSGVPRRKMSTLSMDRPKTWSVAVWKSSCMSIGASSTVRNSRRHSSTVSATAAVSFSSVARTKNRPSSRRARACVGPELVTSPSPKTQPKISW